MSRQQVIAATVFIAIRNAMPAWISGSCADEQILLQNWKNIVRYADAKPAEVHASPARDILVGVHGLVDKVKGKIDSSDNISRAATRYLNLVVGEVIPSIQTTMAELGNDLATQLTYLKHCDVDLEAGLTLKDDFQRMFQMKLSEHTACVAIQSSMMQKAEECREQQAAETDECIEFKAHHSAKVAECSSIQAEVDTLACTQASHARTVCESYGDCRSTSMAAYKAAAQSFEDKSRDHEAHLLEAKHAQCIAQSLVASAADVKKLLTQLEGCSAAKLDESGRKVRAMPAAMVCQGAEVRLCSGGLLELDVGSANETWSMPCGACPSMLKAPVLPVEKVFAEQPLESSRVRFVAWISSCKDFVKKLVPLEAHRWPTAALNLISTSVETRVHVSGQATGAGVIILVAIPLVFFGIVLFVTVASSPHTRNENESLHHRPASNPISDHRQLHSGGNTRRSIDKRPESASNPYGQAQVFAMSTGSLHPRHSVPALADSRHLSREAVGLCPDLTVPEGNECILGIPFLAGSILDDVVLKTIANKDGQPLLHAGLTRSPAGGEYILLTGQDRQELAFCETGAAVQAEGWTGKIFRQDGKVFAWFREANHRDRQKWSGLPTPRTPRTEGRPSMSPWSMIPGPLKTYVIISAAAPVWELRITGNIRERKFVVEDEREQVVAMVSPGRDLSCSWPTADFYRLRLGPGADSCTVIVTLMAIERLCGS